MPTNNYDPKKLTDEEIAHIVESVKKPGLRYTLDLYLLDYVKHCFLENDQLGINIKKLQAAVAQLDDAETKKGVMEVISCIECVEGEYKEYLEDMKILADGGWPAARGTGQAGDDMKSPEFGG